MSLPFVAVFRVDQFYRRGRGHAQIGYHGCKLLGERAAHVGRYSHVCPRSCRCRQGSVGLAYRGEQRAAPGGRARHGRSTAQRCRLHRRCQRARYVRCARCGHLGRTARSPAADARARRGHGRRPGKARRAARSRRPRARPPRACKRRGPDPCERAAGPGRYGLRGAPQRDGRRRGHLHPHRQRLHSARRLAGLSFVCHDF